MKKHYFKKMTICLVLSYALLFSCRQNTDPSRQKPSLPSLGKLQKLTVHGLEIDYDTWTVKLPYAKDRVATGDVKASFKLEGIGELEPEVNKSPVMLQEGVPVKVSLKVPQADGKHASWSKEIKVIRGTQDGVGILQLASLFVCNQEVKNLTDLQNLTINIPSHIAELQRDHFDPIFKLEGKDQNVNLNITSLPLPIAEEETKELSLQVQATAKYKEWKGKIKIKREKRDTNTDPELDLASLTIATESVDIRNGLDNLSVIVDHKVARIRKSHVQARFLLHGQDKEVRFNISPTVLELDYEESKALTITVPAKKGEYKKWSYNVKVTRQAIPEDPTPMLFGLMVCENQATRVGENEYFVEVSNKNATITQRNIKPTFKFNSYGSGPDANVKVKFEGLPLKLEEGGKGTVKLSIEALQGKYKAFGPITITIKRDINNSDPKLELDRFGINRQQGRIRYINDEIIEVVVSEDKEEFIKNDIRATFTLKGQIKNVELKVVEPLPITLTPGVEQAVTLLVDAKPGEYREWRRTLKITRFKPLPQLELKDLKVWNTQARKDMYDNWSVEIPSNVERVSITNFEYSFELEGQPKMVTLESDDLPLLLDMGQTRRVSCSVRGKEKEYAEWNASITITRKNLPHARGVSAKVTDQKGKTLNVSYTYDIKTFKTDSDNVTVTIESSDDAVITEVTVAGENVNVAQGGKSAQTTVEATSQSKEIDITIKFQAHREQNKRFILQKVNLATEEVKLEKYKFYKRSDHSDRWNNECYSIEHNESTKTITLEESNIPYSCVKLHMEFDEKIKSAEITKCEDGRSSNYSTNPNYNDKKGIFSGRVAKAVDSRGSVETLTAIDERKYTEYLIVGYGTVKYTIKFEFEGRPTSIYTIMITNQNSSTYWNTVGIVSSNGYHAVIEGNTFSWVGGYVKEPLQQSWQAQSVDSPEYMGDNVPFIFGLKADDTNDMYFYYHLYDDRNSEACHEFVRINKRGAQQGLYLVSLILNPEEKCIDAFIGSEKKLPIMLHPKYTNKAWKKVLNKGFRLWVSNNLTEKDNNYTEVGKKLKNCLSVRTQTQIYKKNNADGHSNPVALKLGKKQKFKDWLTGDDKTLEHDNYLLDGSTTDSKDVFVLYPTFFLDKNTSLANHIDSFSCAIKKRTDVNGPQWEDVDAEWKTTTHSLSDKKFIVIGGKDGCIKDNDDIDKSKTFSFVDGEVYKVELALNLLGGGKEFFNYEFYYNDEEQEMQQYSLGTGSDDLFGVPTSY